MPTSQGVQFVGKEKPACCPNVPAGQGVAVPLTQKKPMGHVMHEEEPAAGAYFPGGQVRQAARDEKPEDCPKDEGGHGKQASTEELPELGL